MGKSHFGSVFCACLARNYIRGSSSLLLHRVQSKAVSSVKVEVDYFFPFFFFFDASTHLISHTHTSQRSVYDSAAKTSTQSRLIPSKKASLST